MTENGVPPEVYGALIGAGIGGGLAGLLMIVCMWRVFSKAGQPGWASLIPIYNTYVLLKTAGRPGWWLLLCLIPLVNVVVSILVLIDLAKSFGKGAAFGVFGLCFFGIIGFPMLAFGSAQYYGPAALAGRQQQYPM